jgi:hypothetical protein
MNLPSYFEPRPDADWGAETVASFEQLYTQAVEHGSGAVIDYALAAPKWQFLCYLGDRKKIVLHGSGNPNIAEFEPRQSNDVNEFGNRRAVYAASDGIWPMFFAIVDRDHGVTSLTNSCFRIVEPGQESGPYYFFSINGDALPHAPWRAGMIYVLPGDTFEQQRRVRIRGVEIDLAQWASLVPVKPLARLAVRPDDFPFLSHIHPHDPAVIRERARADPDGFPWIDV